MSEKFANLDGVIIGRALYEGTVNLARHPSVPKLEPVSVADKFEAVPYRFCTARYSQVTALQSV